MRIPSGSTDRRIYFVALDATDHITPETGLDTFTVVRSRNGGSAVTYTTPTIVEINSSTMPGVYALTIDEDTTIGGGHDTEEYCLFITHEGMKPVTAVLELYRPETTEGQTLSVSSGIGLASVPGFNLYSGVLTQPFSGTTGNLGSSSQDQLDGAILVFQDVLDLNQYMIRTILTGSLEEVTLNVAVNPSLPAGTKFWVIAASKQDIEVEGGVADWTSTERQQIRHRLGIDGTSIQPSAIPSILEGTSIEATPEFMDAVKGEVSEAVEEILEDEFTDVLNAARTK